MLTVRNLSCQYGSRPVLWDVSFTLQEGELVFLLGANGAGKSTLFRCILGLLPQYKGELLIQGNAARTLSPRTLARLISYVPQNHHPTFAYSALNMVLMGTNHALPPFASPGKREYALARKVMEQLGIGDLENRDFNTLSGGEQQLVLTARAIAQQGKILLMDEPTASLDYGNQLRVLEQTRELARQGYTILLSCHDPQLALLYADRVIALHDGKIIADGKPGQVITPELLRTLYQVDVSFTPTPKGVLLSPAALSDTCREDFP